MTDKDQVAYREVMKRTTKDLHDRCGVDLNILWDDGKLVHVDGFHKVKLWNGLGAFHYQVEHRNLMERGAAYRQFLEDVAAAVKQRLTVTA